MNATSRGARKMSAEDSQRIVVEAIQHDIPVGDVMRALGVDFQTLTDISNAKAQITGSQHAAVIRLMRECGALDD